MITITGNPEDIAALAVALQGRQCLENQCSQSMCHRNLRGIIVAIPSSESNYDTPPKAEARN